VFEQLFQEVVAQCLAVGLVRGDKLSVDGSFVEAKASKESRIPREQLAEAAQVNRTVREYLGIPRTHRVRTRGDHWANIGGMRYLGGSRNQARIGEVASREFRVPGY
jgi:hypothetical protein